MMCYAVNVALHVLIFTGIVGITWAECGGKTAIYDLLNGTITLRHGSDTLYLPNTYCEWLIRAPQPGQKILLTFREFDTECGFDYLKIYDGSSKQRLLGSFSGNTIPPSLVSNTSAIVVDFCSDLNYVRAGSVIDFKITDCPGNCMGHGNCVGNHCHCDELYTGAACDIEICPEFCNNATKNGQCSKSDGCKCNDDFIGQSCSFSLRDNLTVGSWHLIRDHSPVFRNRFAHAGVYARNAFWIFGGYNLNEVYDDLIKFNFDENSWQIIQPTGNRPASRFRHTMVTFEDSLVVYGGELENGTLLNDLWIFNITTAVWRRMEGNNGDSPPGLASHCACVYDRELIIFGGQTQDYGFSYEMYMYNLVKNVWRRISYNLAKISDLRLVGHSCVFYATLNSMIVFGGYRADSGRQSKKVKTLLMYNVDGKVWLPIATSGGPKPTVYHSSVIVGDYMVSYGGIVHTHHEDETCYGKDIYLLNLKNFTWSSVITDNRNKNSNIRGRYSHVVVVFDQRILLVAGGFSGVASGDFLAYKIPPSVMHNAPTSSHMCHTFTQCVSCLTWGSQSDLPCGWCVHDSTCYPRASPSHACSTSQTRRGWWGIEGLFLTVVDQCRIKDKPPGLIAEIKFGAIVDHVHVLHPLKETIDTKTRRLVLSQKRYNIAVRWFGFIYPYLTESVDEIVSLKFRGDKSASLHLSTDESPVNTVKVISFKGSRDGSVEISNEAERPPNGSIPLFPNAAKNKMYYIEVKIQHETVVGATNTDSLSLQVLNAKGDVIDGRFLRPFFSDNCEQYSTCLKCLSDMSCGWCSTTNTCMVRNSSMKCQHSSGEVIYLVLNATYCETCGQHVHCNSCIKDETCDWDTLQQLCYDLQPAEDKKSVICVPSCTSYTDCRLCVSNTKCLWCESQDKCFPWASHPASFIYGQCAHWSSIFSGERLCSTCSQQKTCADCWETTSCGWCGEFHNGSCFEGGYDAPYGGSCNQLLSSSGPASSYSYKWSYAQCPDENECITRRDCHEHATCTDTVGSYKCECKEGFAGNGTFCKALCNPPCVHGDCIKHPSNVSLDECKCHLGWTGPICSDDCGCHNHSTCHIRIGLCDDCQELTHGKNCEYCVPGSYGSATTSLGCTRCECNGHGDEQRGICDNGTGHCFCMNNTMGAQCDQCLPGFFGHPQRGEGCYYPCKAHAILSNMARGALSSLPEPGQEYDPNNVNCVWTITTLNNNSGEVVYSSDLAPGTITFRIKDIALDCQTDHVYIYDGMPNFKLDATKSSFNLIGSLCGTNPSSIPAIESNSGTLVVVFKGNVSLNSPTSGFNASFVINNCPKLCTGNRHCHSNGIHENCVCKQGWTGTACDDAVCPSNCSESLGNGHCDQISGKCVCKNGYAGPSCNIQYQSDDFIWKYSTYIDGSNSTLARMGHTLAADVVTESLIIYGGYSLYFTVLGDIWKYSTKTKNYVRETSWNTTPSPRYFHAADIYERVMYVTGGITNKGYSSEVWKYDLDTSQWQQAQDLPRKLAGHTLNIINGTLYLIGGYSPDEQCSSKVYTLNLDSDSFDWTDLNLVGFDACFGHTTVYDRFARSLVVFGKKANKMEPTLAVLKLTTNELDVVSNVPQEYLRYFHVSMIVGDVMIVVSGYTGGDIQDFAGQPLVYDLRCGSWHKYNLKGIGPSFLAHSAVTSMNDELYIFGGYNGLSSDKLYRQNTSSNWCAMFSTEVSCKKISNCVWCVNIASSLAACYASNTYSHLNCTSANNVCEIARYKRSEDTAETLLTDVCIRNTVPGDCPSCMRGSTCSWSVDSYLCFPFFYQPITCAFGICGRVLRPYDVCPTSCNISNYCYDCLEQFNCGWCTSETDSGLGACTEGSLHGPYNATCFSPNDSLTIWVSSVCLRENECLNGHHHCNENETCVDQEISYECVCSNGYKRINGSCLPICNQGCVYGSCIDPDKCLCDFGWVGSNCSIACQCHRHGRCLSETQLDYCQDCQNYTTGRSCERCIPGYVGENGHCESCLKICNENAEICYSSVEIHTTNGTIYGPRYTSDLRCECGDNSEGIRCKSCKTGYFGSNNKCVKCKCRGHAATCDKNTGLDCVCQNKTQTPKNAGNTKQCSQCMSPYRGSPDVEGQQCYLNLEGDFYKRFAREYLKSTNLLPFQTSFYYIQPSISNIDIRLIIDISYGLLDVFIANGDNAFKVDPNQNVSISLTKIGNPEYYTDGLNTYTTFSGKTQVIIVKKVEHRLVVIFPSDEHEMEKTKFYVILKAGHNGADGIIYFKQDHTKINLVVFFIVFTSSFVFLLSAVFIAWSMKNHLHSRQEVHNREVEHERLHNRPFANFAFLFEYQSPSPSVTRHRKTTASTRKAVRPMGVQCTSDYHATVTTVLFQLPQTEKTKMTLCLGTTLALVTPQQMDKLAQPSAPKQMINM